MSELKKAALAYAARGIKVFPLAVGTKVPLEGTRGFYDATDNPELIEKLWGDNEYNIAFQPQQMGWAIIDADDYAVPGGDALAGLDLPPTFEVRTARGGRHSYYAGDLPPTQNRLAPHVDTRGGGSYALLPPSRFAGGLYTVVSDAPVAPLPAWVGEKIAEGRKARMQAITEDLDTSEAISRARAHLMNLVRQGKVAVEGDQGDYRTYVTAAEMVNFGLSEDKAVELLLDLYNPHCVPPWTEEDLRTKVQNASAYAQNEPGSWTPAPPSERLADALGKLIAERTEEPPQRKRLFKGGELRLRPKPKWLVPDLIQERGSVLLYGPPKTFKTSVVLDAAMHVATGASGWGREEQEPRQVLFISGEASENVDDQAHRWAMARGMRVEDYPFYIYEGMDPLVAQPEKRELLAAAIHDAKLSPDLIILDTARKALAGMNENDSRDVGMFADMVDDMRRAYGSAVLAIHHAPKDGDGPRGSIVFVADFDTVHVVERERDIVTVRNEAQRLAAEREEPWRFQVEEGLLNPMTGAEWAQRRKSDDPLSMMRVMAVLRKFSRPVTQEVLASTIAGQFADMDDAERATKAISAKLSRRFDLQGAFTQGQGPSRMWSIAKIGGLETDQP